MSIKVIYGTKQANAEIVTLAQAKANSRIEYDTEDDLLQLLLDSATDEIENYLNSPVILRTGSTLKFSTYSKTYDIRMPANVTALSYIDTDGNTTEVDNALWTYEDNILEIDMDIPSKFKEFVITADLGYDVAAIPKDIKRAALLIFSHSESYRESFSIKFNQSAYNLLRNYRLIW